MKKGIIKPEINYLNHSIEKYENKIIPASGTVGLGKINRYDEEMNMCICYRSSDLEWKIPTSTLEVLKTRGYYIHEGLNNNHFETH